MYTQTKPVFGRNNLKRKLVNPNKFKYSFQKLRLLPSSICNTFWVTMWKDDFRFCSLNTKPDQNTGTALSAQHVIRLFYIISPFTPSRSL